MDQSKSIEEQARDVFNKRRATLLQNASNEIKSCFKEDSMFEQIDELIKNIHNNSEPQQVFLLNLLIAATRVWEAFNKNQDGEYSFEIWTKANRANELKDMIRQDFYRIRIIIDNNVEITPFVGDQKRDLLIQVEQELLRNIKTIRIILVQEVTEDQIKIFLTKVQLYSFCHTVLEKHLNGLSTYDGTKIYFAQNKYVTGNYNKLTRILEHECIHSLIRYFSKEKDPLFISPKNYPQLKTENGELIEAGDYYDMKAHDKWIQYPSPFCMQAPKLRLYK